MFTNNFIELQKAAFMGTTAALKRVSGSDVTLRLSVSTFALNLAGLGRWLNVGRCSTVTNSVSFSSNSFGNDKGVGGVWFGTSPTPATKEDYSLGSAITSGLTVTSPSSVTQKDEGGGKYTFLSDFIVRNDTEADINIYEIGLFTVPVEGPAAYSILVERTVLTEPIVIPAGESKLVTYAIRFNQTLSVD